MLLPRQIRLPDLATKNTVDQLILNFRKVMSKLFNINCTQIYIFFLWQAYYRFCSAWFSLSKFWHVLLLSWVLLSVGVVSNSSNAKRSHLHNAYSLLPLCPYLFPKFLCKSLLWLSHLSMPFVPCWDIDWNSFQAKFFQLLLKPSIYCPPQSFH